ncbi:MAG: fumarylacetoacetate hydrolase family protein, partial [Gemmatimonadota bacterium]
MTVVAPSKIICVGRNYRAHAQEMGQEMPAAPMLFFKPPSALIGPDEPI